MGRASFGSIVALACLSSVASAQSSAQPQGNPQQGGQEVIVDPQTGQVVVRNSQQAQQQQQQPLPPPAQAQPAQPAEPPPPPTPAQPPPAVVHDHELEKRTSVAGQAGLITYTGEAARLTTPGASYGLSVAYDLIRGVNAELGYVGSSYRVEGTTGGVSENGADVLMKVGPEYGHFSPFALWGLELSWLGTHGPAEGIQDATLLRLPMGAGLAYTLPSDSPAEVTLGLRAAYLFTLTSGAFPGLAEPFAANQFLSTLSVGGRF